MKWVYILKCEDNYYYVGETNRLYRRRWQHNEGNGGLNTSTYEPESIVAIYKVSSLSNFFDYDEIVTNEIYNIYFNRANKILENFQDETYETDEDNKLVENHIAEAFIIHKNKNKEDWTKIRGGKYTRFDIEYTLPKNDNIKNLPFCYCGLPCDIKNYEGVHEMDNYLYFRCAKKNMWLNMKEDLDINIESDACKYFMKYNDILYKTNYQERKKTIQNIVNKSNWLNSLVGTHSEFCIGGCGKQYDENNTIRYSSRAINLCFDCFINKNDELSKKYKYSYKPIGKCLITL